MGRPKNTPPVATKPEEMVKLPELKKCSRCQGAATGPWLDIHRLYRCSCSVCHYYDCVASYTPLESVEKWNRSN